VRRRLPGGGNPGMTRQYPCTEVLAPL